MKFLLFLLRQPFCLFVLLTLIPMGAYSRGGHGCHSHGHSHGGGHSHSHSHYHYSHIGHGGSGARGDFKQSYLANMRQPMAHVVGIGASAGTSDMMVVPEGNMNFLPSNYMFNLRYQLNDWLALDLSAGTGTLSGRDTCNCKGLQRVYNYDIKAYKIAAGLSVMYYSGALLQYYGGVQAGVCWFTEQDHYLDGKEDTWNGAKFTGQITLLGVRFGHKLGIFGEFGVGCKGLVNMGISYQPNWSPEGRAGRRSYF